MYPNPASDQLFVTAVPDDEGNLDSSARVLNGVQVVDMQGKVVLEDNSVSEHITLQIGAIKTGTYMLRTILDGEVIVKELKVIRD